MRSMFTNQTIQDSPLHQSLPEGTVITSLDDFQLTSSDTSLDLWTWYLSHKQPHEGTEIGWCVEAGSFLGQYL